MNELVLFKGREFSLMIPPYLKSKGGKLYFVADRSKEANPGIKSLAVDIPYSGERADTCIAVLSRTRDSNFGGFENRTIAMGEVAGNAGGFELLSESHNTATKASFFRYHQVFCLPEGPVYGYAVFDKNGRLDDFRELCREVVESIDRLGHESTRPTPISPSSPSGPDPTQEFTLKTLPQSVDPIVVRTDFHDNAAWDEVCSAIRRACMEFLREDNLTFVNDPDFDGLTPERLPTMIAPDDGPDFLFLVDSTTLSHPDHPLLVVNLDDEAGPSFRVIPAEMITVYSNLSIANMDFEDFVVATDPEGIFRGFPGY